MRLRVATATALVAVVATASACAGGSTASRVDRPASAAAPAPLPGTTPYLVMTASRSGFLVWHSGDFWLALYTSDRFAHVANRTPVAVPTEGGLALSVGSRAVVAVGAAQRLAWSPVLLGSRTGVGWQPRQLPAAVSEARDSVSASGPGQLDAVIDRAGGTLVAAAGAGWRTVVSANGLAATGRLRLDATVWANSSTGWLTGHGDAGVATAFQTTDGGHHWQPVRSGTPVAIASLAPCGSGSNWTLTQLSNDGTQDVLRTTDAGAHWAIGASLRSPSGVPAWGCLGDAVWMVGAASTGDRLFVSSDQGRSWADRGAAPAGLTDVVPTGGGSGLAVSPTSLWSVTDDGRSFRAIALAPWVAQLAKDVPAR